MYLFKLQPIYFDQSLWQDTDAYEILSAPVEIRPSFPYDGDKVFWVPFEPYAINTAVKRGQYVYYSCKDDNTDDPYYNYIGIDLSTNENYSNPTWLIGKGQDSWIRGRSLHDYDCINYNNPGATQRGEYCELQIKPRKLGNLADVDHFYSTGEQYLILYGLAAQRIVVEFYDEDDQLMEDYTEDISSSENVYLHKRIMLDFHSATFLYPSLPAILNDTLFFNYLPTMHRIVIKLWAGNTGLNTKIKHIFVGSPYKIGHTQGKDITFGGLDYSRVNYDDWGRMTLIRGKKAKTLRTTVALPKQIAQDEEWLLRLLQSCRATPTLFWAANSFPIGTYVSSLPLLLGLIKSSAINELNSVYKELDLTIEGIPLDYNA